MASSANETSYSTTVETSRIILLSILPIKAIMTVVANGLYIITLVKKRVLHTPSNMLLGALALSDVSVGIVADPTWMIRISPTSNTYVRKISERASGMMFFFILLSFLNITMVSADRYIAIFYPFWYHANATCKTHIKAAATVLAISIVIFIPVGIIATIHIPTATYIYITLIGLSLIVTCYCNIKIFCLIRKKGRLVNTVPNETNEETNKQYAARVAHVKSNAVVIAIITALFVICYMPFTIYFLVRYLGISLNREQTVLISYWTIFFMLMNSVMNPIVYYIRMRSIRKAIKELFCKSN